MSVSVRQQEQALRHSARGQMQRAHARLMTRTLLHMHRHIQTHTHTPWAVSFRLWGWTQGRCCRRHRVSVSAAAGTGSQAQGKQAGAACGCAPYDEDTTTHAQAHTDTHAHSMRYELQSVVLDARALLQAAPRQCQCGSRNRLSGTGQAGKCSVRMPCASCMAMGRIHGSQSPEHSTHGSKR